MELFRHLESSPPDAQPRDRGVVLAIGSFDGVHKGHQERIRRTRDTAARLGAQAGLVSFEPLPREFFKPQDPPARLTNLRERWRLFQHLGLDRVYLLPFNHALRSLDGAQFLQALQRTNPRGLVVGHDFRFGRGGQASAQWLAEEAGRAGCPVQVVDAVLQGEHRISSGLVREALANADLTVAQRLLGRPYSMRGRVRHGQELGRTLGFPTANIPSQRRRCPLQGVFAVRVLGVDGTGKAWPGVANLGTRPMVGGQGVLLEAHLFDFNGNLYGLELEVQFVARLREERVFASMAAMVEQMHADAAEARRILDAPGP